MRTSIIFISLLVILGYTLQPQASEKRHAMVPIDCDYSISHRSTATNLDSESDTLAADDGNPAYVFRFPDVYDDDFRNQKYTMYLDATVKGVMFGFTTISHEQYSTGDPDLVTIIWSSNGDTENPSLPGEELLRDTTLFEEFGDRIYDLNDEWTGEYDQFVIVDLQDKGLNFSTYDEFHVGYSAIMNSPDDSLAILSDDATTSWESSEWYDDEFHYMRETWRGVNFLIRVIIETPEGTMILPPYDLAESYNLLKAYPNPFNAQTSLRVNLAKPGDIRLDAFDILGRHIDTIFSGAAAKGELEIGLNAQSWTSGVYFIRMQTEQQQAIYRIILEK